MNEEDIKNAFKDSKTVHIEDPARNPYEYFMEGIVARAELEITKITERFLFSDIIAIYKGCFKDYTDYYNTIVDYNSKCREHNQPKLEAGKYNLQFNYEPERRLLLERHFEYIRSISPYRYNENEEKD